MKIQLNKSKKLLKIVEIYQYFCDFFLQFYNLIKLIFK